MIERTPPATKEKANEVAMDPFKKSAPMGIKALSWPFIVSLSIYYSGINPLQTMLSSFSKSLSLLKK